MRKLLVAVLVGLCAAPATAGPLETWSERAEELIRQAILERLRPTATPSSSWRLERVSTLPLALEVVASASHDVDGDGRAEALLLTREELIAVELGASPSIFSRSPLPRSRPGKRSRIVIGTLAVRGTGVAATVVARTSEQARALTFRWSEGRLVPLGHEDGYPVCDSHRLEQVNRTHLLRSSSEDAGQVLWWMGCAGPWVTAESQLRTLSMRVDTRGALTLDWEEHCLFESNCAAGGKGRIALQDVGIEPSAGDLDGDGTLEIVTASSHPSPKRDVLRLFRVNRNVAAEVFRHRVDGQVGGSFVANGAAFLLVSKTGVPELEVWRLHP